MVAADLEDVAYVSVVRPGDQSAGVAIAVSSEGARESSGINSLKS
jgi:hypothetical protein